MIQTNGVTSPCLAGSREATLRNFCILISLLCFFCIKVFFWLSWRSHSQSLALKFFMQFSSAFIATRSLLTISASLTRVSVDVFCVPTDETMAFRPVGLNSGPLRASMGRGADDLLKQVAHQVHTFKNDKRLKTDKTASSSKDTLACSISV